MTSVDVVSFRQPVVVIPPVPAARRPHSAAVVHWARYRAQAAAREDAALSALLQFSTRPGSARRVSTVAAHSTVYGDGELSSNPSRGGASISWASSPATPQWSLEQLSPMQRRSLRVDVEAAASLSSLAPSDELADSTGWVPPAALCDMFTATPQEVRIPLNRIAPR